MVAAIANTLQKKHSIEWRPDAFNGRHMCGNVYLPASLLQKRPRGLKT